MDNTPISQPIIQSRSLYAGYPLVAIHPMVRAYLDRAKARIEESSSKLIQYNNLILRLECYLQISGKTLGARDLLKRGFKDLCDAFVGALYSDTFVESNYHRRYLNTQTLSRLLHEVKNELPKFEPPTWHILSTRPTEEIEVCKKKFASLELNEEAVWLWRSWHTTNRVGRKTQLPLYPIYKRLGREFTTAFSSACDQYYSGRKCQRIIALPELAAFIGAYEGTLKPESFQDASFVTRFWRAFAVFYVETAYAAGNDLAVSITNWRNEFEFFVKEYLIGTKLFAETYGEFPGPPSKLKNDSRTHIKVGADGIEIKVKLLTHVPLQVTDSQAMEILFRRIRRDVELIEQWANHSIRDLWSRYKLRIASAPQGKVRTFARPGQNNGIRKLTRKSNLNYTKNVAATFKAYGYTLNKISSQLYTGDLCAAAHVLALPVTSALLPHCAQLVLKHPQITPAFLESLELFDKHAQRTGLIKQDGGYVLQGTKGRKGPEKSQQLIYLTPETTRIVLQIIVLTNPLRQFLRAQGDDNWRKLFLTCAQAFAYPKPIARLATNTSLDSRVTLTAKSIHQITKIPEDESYALAKRFSLPTLRASAGVLVYLESRDLKKMSDALGHTQCSTSLLARYLPAPIRSFFQERWIRLFQTGLIIEALKDSPFLLQAANFQSIDELHQFLSNHALKLPPKEIADPDYEGPRIKDPATRNETLIAVNPAILSALISMHEAVKSATRAPCGQAVYWAQIGEQVTNYIDSEYCKRPDLKTYLKLAREQADPKLMESLLYGQD